MKLYEVVTMVIVAGLVLISLATGANIVTAPPAPLPLVPGAGQAG